MKKVLFVLSLLIATQLFSQTRVDSLKESIDDHKMRLDAFDERMATIVSDVEKLTKIKISGYLQSQFDYYDQQSANYLKTANSIIPTGITNSFYIRRARLKATYEATDGVKFVLQPDFSTGNIALKDAYVVINDRWLKTFSLYAGQFNRPNYEVEYSSSSREVFERSKVVKALYPGEREIGAKLEAKPTQFPLKVQLAFINGNFTGTEAKDADNAKDFMARAVYSLKFQQQGIGIDFGANGYLGQIRTKDSKYIQKSDLKIDSLGYAGKHIPKSWIGAEMQIYWDFLGGLALKGEFIAGKNTTIGTNQTSTITTKIDTSLTNYPSKIISSVAADGSFTTTTNTSSKVTMPGNNHLYEITTTKTVTKANLIRNFSGYYIYLVKNIGKDHQLAARWDNYTPNNFDKDKITSYSDLTFNTLTVAWNYFYDENIRITIGYEMPMNKTNNTTFKKDVIDNTFSVRLQAKF